MYLISLVVAGHRDAGGGDGCQVGTDLVQTQGVLHPLLGTMHQHLLELHGAMAGEQGRYMRLTNTFTNASISKHKSA